MEALCGFELEQYIRAELVSMHHFMGLCVSSAWTLMTPFRAVICHFLKEIWRGICMNASTQSAFAMRYQRVLQSPLLRELHGPVYALLSVPEQVLKDEPGKYGKYGEVICAWWTATKVAFYEYLPDLILKTSTSFANFMRAFWEAYGSMGKRLCSWIEVSYWCLLLLV
ncbi:hypothetical protein JG688_00008031 [Phytophthora aleatoria]|uniref:Uncharacterized protein n=1 Tax=Phytophthora aleatoria TaxID=2496075 RepID=A0A8J5MFT6_9STRA|nr:hypothetical protein JG688_00008031 [Phytophthora aleatoria]